MRVDNRTVNSWLSWARVILAPKAHRLVSYHHGPAEVAQPERNHNRGGDLVGVPLNSARAEYHRPWPTDRTFGGSDRDLRKPSQTPHAVMG